MNFLLAILLFISLPFFRQEISFNEIDENHPKDIEKQIYQWILHQQLPNGLIKNSESSKYSSLYNNALAALLFTSQSDYKNAEKIFDYFNSELKNEFDKNNKGFSQMRTLKGKPNGRDWMGDNAWLLIAINNYHHKTNSKKYQQLAKKIETYLRFLQDIDGGLWGGHESNGKQIPKITEGILDAFNAVEGFDDFHINILKFLKNTMWDTNNKYLKTTDEHHKYSVALDLHAWSYCVFEDYPEKTLLDASKFLTTQQITTTQKLISGYCFDLDNDCVWLEGTGQMVVAFNFSKNTEMTHYFLNEMEKSILKSAYNKKLVGLPYVSNNATNFGSELIWKSADSEPSIAPSVWYLFAKLNYNPFEIGFKKNIPAIYKFWIN